MSATKTYWQKLQDPRWQKKRLEIFKRDGFECKSCGSKDKQLQVHHGYYVSKREPWDYPDTAYKTLCFECHEELTKIGNEHPHEWEFLFGINEESGDNLSHSLLHRCHELKISPVLFIKLLSNAMDKGLVDHETISIWKNSFEESEKEARMRSNHQDSDGGVE